MDGQNNECKYHNNVQCSLAPQAPYCHMQCELNEEAKEYSRQLTKRVNKQKGAV